MSSHEENTPAIILVEDDAMLCSLLERVLKSWGFDVRTTSSVAAGKELLSLYNGALKPILISDLEIGPSNGEELLDYVLENNTVSGALVISGAFDFAAVISRLCIKFQKEQIQFFASAKPFEHDELRELINRVNLERLAAIAKAGALQFHSKSHEQILSLVRNKANPSFLYSCHPGIILEQARATLGLSISTFLRVLKEDGIYFSFNRYTRLKTTPASKIALTAVEWAALSELLHMPYEFLQTGYKRSTHLARMSYALDTGSFLLPFSNELRLLLLERQEWVPEKYSDNIAFEEDVSSGEGFEI